MFILIIMFTKVDKIKNAPINANLMKLALMKEVLKKIFQIGPTLTTDSLAVFVV